MIPKLPMVVEKKMTGQKPEMTGIHFFYFCHQTRSCDPPIEMKLHADSDGPNCEVIGGQLGVTRGQQRSKLFFVKIGHVTYQSNGNRMWSLGVIKGQKGQNNFFQNRLAPWKLSSPKNGRPKVVPQKFDDRRSAPKNWTTEGRPQKLDDRRSSPKNGRPKVGL